ncbi:endolytic transglycosylase MltG [Peptococcaceae bacterium 1198_IL3148]
MNKSSSVMKQIPIIILLVLSLLVMSVVGVLIYFNTLLNPVANNAQPPVIVEVPANSTSSSVAALLEKKGLIKSATAFRVYSRYKGLDSQIQTGEYQLTASMSTPEILNTIIEGNQVFYSFTVPEGYTVEEIAQLLDNKGYADKDEFLELCQKGDFDYPFLKEQANTKYVLEGYLFPDTYKITKQMNEQDIILMMLNRFVAEAEKLNLAAKAKKLNFSLHQAVTVAAMIEREAIFDKERPRISGVIQNRLKIGMPLQIDATVLYALGQHKEVVLYKDLEVDSPYNTYRVQQLPPGPIACPGSASLKAAVEPEETDYLYYLAKPDGTHVFTNTLAEHQHYKEKYL